ncbi:hypothetical protein OUZ56_032595 [Daphnia magna]|uniref:Uncharacterized protein n=1 Tax=Daphnia magna TaxID=35525 RepID=A0ABR0B9C9_9CRUS|nr:hypothetical protein OUZ56_032595 [Daphnia magna]
MTYPRKHVRNRVPVYERQHRKLLRPGRQQEVLGPGDILFVPRREKPERLLSDDHPIDGVMENLRIRTDAAELHAPKINQQSCDRLRGPFRIVPVGRHQDNKRLRWQPVRPFLNLEDGANEHRTNLQQRLRAHRLFSVPPRDSSTNAVRRSGHRSTNKRLRRRSTFHGVPKEVEHLRDVRKLPVRAPNRPARESMRGAAESLPHRSAPRADRRGPNQVPPPLTPKTTSPRAEAPRGTAQCPQSRCDTARTAGRRATGKAPRGRWGRRRRHLRKSSYSSALPTWCASKLAKVVGRPLVLPKDGDHLGRDERAKTEHDAQLFEAAVARRVAGLVFALGILRRFNGRPCAPALKPPIVRSPPRHDLQEAVFAVVEAHGRRAFRVARRSLAAVVGRGVRLAANFRVAAVRASPENRDPIVSPHLRAPSPLQESAMPLRQVASHRTSRRTAGRSSATSSVSCHFSSLPAALVPCCGTPGSNGRLGQSLVDCQCVPDRARFADAGILTIFRRGTYTADDGCTVCRCGVDTGGPYLDFKSFPCDSSACPPK